MLESLDGSLTDQKLFYCFKVDTMGSSIIQGV